jgi:hypothetical protein
MWMMKKLLIFIVILSSVPSTVLAAPLLYNPIPQPGSYIYGRTSDMFSIDITESSLNTSTAQLHFKVKDPTSTWSAVGMNCLNSTLQDWICNATVPGLGALVIDGSTLRYYFDVNNTSNEYGSNGTESNYNNVSIDRLGPAIVFDTPKNESYTHGSLKISLLVIDQFSGVNSSTVEYSFDNSTWLSTTLSGLYVADNDWDTSSYSNNQTVTIYATASDNLGTANYTEINVTVDNEVPKVFVNSPQANQILSGYAWFEFTSKDDYSGLDNSTASYSIGDQSGAMTCNGTIRNYTCSNNFTTNTVSDGSYSLNFSIADFAGNIGSNLTSVIIDNIAPTISFEYPTNNNQVSGTITIKIKVTDAGSGVDNVTFRWTIANNTNTTWTALDCSGNSQTKTCSKIYDTTNLTDGKYKLEASANDKTGKQTFATIDVTIANNVQTGGTTTTRNSGTGTTLGQGQGITTTTKPANATGTGNDGGLLGSLGSGTTDFLYKNSTSIVIAIAIIVMIAGLVYLFWPKGPQKVYPGYKPQS